MTNNAGQKRWSNQEDSLGYEQSKQSQADELEGLEPPGSSQVSSASVAAVVQHPLSPLSL